MTPDASRTELPGARLAAVETACSDAEHDLTVLLTRPSLFDPADPATAHFLQARVTARRSVRADGDGHASWTAVQAVTELEQAWAAARAEADRLRLTRFRRRQRLRLRRARRLLEKARADRGNPKLRQACCFKGLALLDGLVVLPEPVRHELLEAARRNPGPSGATGPGWPVSS